VNGGTLDLNGTTQGVGNFTGSGGTILNNSTGTNVTFTIGNGNATGGNYAGVIADHTSGTGTVALTKTGTGTITLSGANTYSGLTTVSAGILNIQNATALGTTTNGTSVTSGATLQIQGGITVGAEALTLNGSGASGQNGALVNVSGTNNYGGLVTLGSASTISSDGGTLNLTNTGTITGATFGVTLTGAGNGSVSSVIGTTTGTLTKNGAGAWTLTGANTYTGGTTVNAGSLFINNTSGSGTGTGTITVTGSGTTLGGSGNMSGAVSVASGNNLAPGASGVGTTAILTTGALTLSSGSNFQIDINGTTVGTGYDQLAVTGGASIAGSHLLVSVGAAFTQSAVGDTFAILSNITAGAITGQFQGLSEGASFNSGSDQFMITYMGTAGGTDPTSGNDIVLTLTAVPEPSTWLAAALALGAVGYMQMRRLRGSSRHRRQER
jgi:autotransporter-associated beta strand protein